MQALTKERVFYMLNYLMNYDLNVNEKSLNFKQPTSLRINYEKVDKYCV
jgi:hypothetical protein